MLLAIVAGPVHTAGMIPNIPATTTVASVPFYSQFSDIQTKSWQKIGCGVTSLSMIIDYYSKDVISVNTVLAQALAIGAYDKNFGWTHKGLINVSNKYNLDGKSYDLKALTQRDAFSQLKKYLNDGPVMVSIHYKFNPKSAIPHLIVVEGIENGVIYYNDPAQKTGQMKISTVDFIKGWKKKFIVIRPILNTSTLASAIN